MNERSCGQPVKGGVNVLTQSSNVMRLSVPRNAYDMNISVESGGWSWTYPVRTRTPRTSHRAVPGDRTIYVSSLLSAETRTSVVLVILATSLRMNSSLPASPDEAYACVVRSIPLPSGIDPSRLPRLGFKVYKDRERLLAVELFCVFSA